MNRFLARISKWVPALTIALYLMVRLMGIDTVVTTDEPFWLGRSGNFYRALVVGDLEHTYQMAHPGVITMWSGAFAYWIHFPEFAQLINGNMYVPYGIESHLRKMGTDPLTIMVFAKVSKVVVQTLFFAVFVRYLNKLVDRLTLSLASLFIAFSPMMSGLDSALHVDGLFTQVTMSAIAVTIWAGFRSEEVSLCE